MAQALNSRIMLTDKYFRDKPSEKPVESMSVLTADAIRRARENKPVRRRKRKEKARRG